MRRLRIPLAAAWFLLPPSVSGQAGLAEWSVDPTPVLEVGVEVVGDSVVVWDYRRRVLSVWSPAGEFLAELRVEHHTTFHEGAPLLDGSVVIPYYGDQRVRAPPSGQYRPRAALFRYVGGKRQDLGPFPYDEMMAGQRVGLPSPYRSRSAVAAGGSPIQIYVGDDTNVPRVRWYDGTGALRDTLRLVDTRDEITRRGWSRMVDTLSLPPGQEKAARRGLASTSHPSPVGSRPGRTASSRWSSTSWTSRWSTCSDTDARDQHGHGRGRRRLTARRHTGLLRRDVTMSPVELEATRPVVQLGSDGVYRELWFGDVVVYGFSPRGEGQEPSPTASLRYVEHTEELRDSVTLAGRWAESLAAFSSELASASASAGPGNSDLAAGSHGPCRPGVPWRPGTESQ